ncbi:hypothetical protein APY04_0834 [Hyphomicrobium sulfonivorans]|uniref:Uncharacterized protein n=1 Tax=Hyphomicrobium sulfonivorans TaxID=121290 RepID=A0A109BL45_HYPSL|nr:hypothetical protein [Hyphomicrobium sulfonivorans]KWT70773.1 hypothetical protein APY04_0834 [Hyphomicrobium sulfonivorans]
MISKTAGSKLWISPVPVNPDTYKTMSNAAGVAALEVINDWIQVEEIEDFGEHGDTSEEITFTSVSDGRVRKLKGSRNAGTKAIVVGRDPLDDGQVALDAAEKTDFNYAFKVQYKDAPSPSHTNSIEYFVGLVLSRPVNQGAENNVVRKTYNVSINSPIFEAPASLIGS